MLPLTAAAEPSPLAEHVVLVSLDGLRPEFYLDPTWPAPLLQQMAREGAHARAVRPVFPAVTYPSHTTIVTGALPARHGVYYNQPFEHQGQSDAWYWYEEAIRLPTLWDAVRQAERTSAAVSWPVTVGAPIDWNVPEVWSLDPEEDPISAMRAATRPAGLFEEIEREATGKLDGSNFGIDYLSRDSRAGAAAAYLLERHRPSLLALHLIEVDHFQHEAGEDAPIVRRALAMADSAISLLVTARSACWWRRRSGPASRSGPRSLSPATTASWIFTPGWRPTFGSPGPG
jgi:predicted AlkP superfamily pyrophosphatase or phosphodiesterase